MEENIGLNTGIDWHFDFRLEKYLGGYRTRRINGWKKVFEVLYLAINRSPSLKYYALVNRHPPRQLSKKGGWLYWYRVVFARERPKAKIMVDTCSIMDISDRRFRHLAQPDHVVKWADGSSYLWLGLREVSGHEIAQNWAQYGPDLKKAFDPAFVRAYGISDISAPVYRQYVPDIVSS